MNKETSPLEYNIRKGKPQRPKWDNALLGLLLGIIFPIIGLLLLYWTRWNDIHFSYYIEKFFHINTPRDMRAVSRLISLSVIMNLIPFYYFMNKKAYLLVKGVIIASVLFLLLVVFYLFIWQ